jgi:diaminopimelate epimerase
MRRLVPFAKFSGAGNDFVLLDARRAPLPRPLAPWIRAVCRRGISAGADGVLVIEGGCGGTVRVGFYNPDGRRHAFCGNGSRCVARWEALRRGRRNLMVSLQTDAGRVQAEVRGKEVRSGLAFALGEPRACIVRVGGRRIRGYEVLAGVPHFVLLREIPPHLPLPDLARQLRSHRAFPEGVNVDFVGAVRRGVRAIRTFERGVEGETLACGSGCVAAALALLARHRRSLRSPVRFRVGSGARIDVRFKRGRAGAGGWQLCGEARLVYHGLLTGEGAAGVGAGR